ncbi:ADP-dependent glucokinase/phosphofructokinase [Hyphomicrobiales bacterium BP6-180914]|uniref:ADP-dependent glucokinase/phosphofructokinase n=2 Tax=Lichenifustis flavocetrariae TaxID=2949735 RepID=A0AA41Z3L3_9HYPH|nr:ADP-dependent glucokinase/phosphofructokinase [Lichenifustis flavocetrariae]
MHDMQALLDASDPHAAAFAALLLGRAEAGVGGEVAVDWPEGPGWLATHVPMVTSLGGTGPHAAWVLSTLGAPALLCLGDRSSFMLEHVPPGILLAEGGRIGLAAEVAPRGVRRPAIFIFEYTAGRAVGPLIPRRSSRIIVRFHNLGLEDDPDFDALTPSLAPQAGAGLLSGYSAVPADDLDRELARTMALGRRWRAAGLQTIHLELAGYDSLDLVERVLASSRGVATSVGMSHSELIAIDGRDGDPAAAMRRLGERTGFDRVCVHADHWAAAVTKRDPDVEMQALMTGCLLASARAEAGKPVLPSALGPSARFHDLPMPEHARHGEWQAVACASPYLERPLTTLGLGDTFTAGCLLALGQERAAEEKRDRATA